MVRFRAAEQPSHLLPCHPPALRPKTSCEPLQGASPRGSSATPPESPRLLPRARAASPGIGRRSLHNGECTTAVSRSFHQ
eukprot:15455979-Alexandrium_andersonii.AAC.1